MAAITDPTAVKFANEKVRVAADAMATMYWTCKALVSEWNATAMSARIPNTADNIVDGSAQDGRHPITAAQATAIITQAQNFIATFEATSNAVLNAVTIPSVNPQARF